MPKKQQFSAPFFDSNTIDVSYVHNKWLIAHLVLIDNLFIGTKVSIITNKLVKSELDLLPSLESGNVWPEVKRSISEEWILMWLVFAFVP